MEERNGLLLQTAIDGFWVVDTEGNILEVNDAYCDLIGYRRDALLRMRVRDVEAAEAPDEIASQSQLIRDTGAHRFETRHKRRDGTFVDLEVSVTYLDHEGGQFCAFFRDITERKRAEEARIAHLRLLEALERVDGAIRQATDTEQMMSDVLQATLEMFDCDRAWLLYPCDPDAPSWSVPMERTQPEYPGALALGEEIPMHPEVADVLRGALRADNVRTIDTRGSDVAPETAKRFSTLSEMHVAIHPRTGSAWLFGLHQCSRYRDWTAEEQRLFREIGRRLSDGLSSLLFFRDLQESEERYRAVVEGTADLITRVNGEGRFTHVNYVAERVLGVNGDECVGLRAFDFVHPDDRERTEAWFKECVGARIEQATIENRQVNRQSGVVTDTLWNSRFHYDANGRLILGDSIARDITERKRTERALAASQRSYREIFDSSNDTIVVHDIKTGAIVHVNARFCELFGYTYDEALRVSVADISQGEPPYTQDDAAAWIRKAIEEGPQRFEWLCRKSSGALFWMEIALQRVTVGGVERIIATDRDITERKEAEEAARKAHEALLAREQREKELVETELAKAREELVRQTRLATLGQLTATVSHEIRNPLGTIRASFYSIADKVRGRPLGIERAMDRVERNIVRCDQIIEELLDYTRTREYKLTPTNMDDWLTEVLDEQDIPEGITMTRRLAAAVEIPLDRERLRRCVVNLVTNACHAMQETKEAGGQLTVETTVTDHRLTIRIRDTGHGITPEHAARIFEPLFTTKGFGVGLGLPIVQQIMEQHSGGIDIESEPDRGTVATMWLPLRVREDQTNGNRAGVDRGRRS